MADLEKCWSPLSYFSLHPIGFQVLQILPPQYPESILSCLSPDPAYSGYTHDVQTGLNLQFPTGVFPLLSAHQLSIQNPTVKIKAISILIHKKT